MFTVEGVDTVAGYDPSKGVIQTVEGANFILRPADAETNEVPWQADPAHVHYVCNQDAECTISHKDTIVHNVRLENQE
jgi:hypothetical protein